MHRVLLVLGAVLLTTNYVYSLPSGPPVLQNPQICLTLMPGHGAVVQQGNGGYVITTDLPRTSANGYSYIAGQTYTGQCVRKR